MKRKIRLNAWFKNNHQKTLSLTWINSNYFNPVYMGNRLHKIMQSYQNSFRYNIHIIELCFIRDSFYWHGFPLIPAWISNDMPGKVWDEITYPFQKFKLIHVYRNKDTFSHKKTHLQLSVKYYFPGWKKMIPDINSRQLQTWENIFQVRFPPYRDSPTPLKKKIYIYLEVNILNLWQIQAEL